MDFYESYSFYSLKEVQVKIPNNRLLPIPDNNLRLTRQGQESSSDPSLSFCHCGRGLPVLSLGRIIHIFNCGVSSSSQIQKCVMGHQLTYIFILFQVKYFDRRRDYLKYKAKIEKDGFEPVNQKQ